MASIIEQTRGEHEDLERLQRLIVDALKSEVVTKKDIVLRDHRVSLGLDIAVKKAKNLLDLYEDKSGVRANEIDVLSGKHSEPYTSFYTRLKELKTYHRNHPETESVDYIRQLPEPTVAFSGEEAFGRNIDLHHLYDIYINIPGIKKQSYLSYLDSFFKLDALPRSIRTSPAYAKYVEHLLAYLEDFYQRSQPLVEWRELENETRKGFAKAWADGTLVGWEANPEAKGKGAGAASGLNLDAISSVQELALLDAEVIKQALSARGLKCGGLPAERAARLFAVKGLSIDQYPVELLASSSAKASKRKRAGPAKVESAAGSGAGSVKASKESADGDGGKSSLREVAETEFRIGSLVQLLMDVVTATKTFTERKLTRTYEERMMEARELEEAERVIAADKEGGSDDEEEAIYNPLNLPLGWDGKPIPYWLYKLHGLGVNFECEICGNAVYRGRRAFDLHFQEWRHAHSMRLLGIPNTKHFHDITKIADAVALFDKLKGLISEEKWDPRVQEEFEDSEGNVLSKNMFQDLARQGLL